MQLLLLYMLTMLAGVMFLGWKPWEIGLIVGASVGACCFIICVIVIIAMNR